MRRPAARFCMRAHRALETLTLDREVVHLRDSLIPRYAEMIYYGYWLRLNVRCSRPLLMSRRKTSPAQSGSSCIKAM